LNTLLSDTIESGCFIRQDALGEEVLQWTGVVKEAADRQLAKIVDGCREEGGEVV